MENIPFRLVSWNVCDGFNRKFGHLERLRPDVAVLQEVRPECLAYAALADRAIWIGDPGQKGLAVVTYNDWNFAEAVAVPQERWFLPARVVKGAASVNVIGAWVDSMKRDLATPTTTALRTLTPFIQAAPTILAGDFNQTITMDARKPVGRKFGPIVEALAEVGLKSAWHAHTGERQGQESQASLYWTWNQGKPFHIDFSFGSETLAIKSASLGSYDQYVAGRISDHVPLVVDYELPA